MVFMKNSFSIRRVVLLLCGAILAVAAVSSVSAPMRATTEDAAKPDRLIYTCEEYGFSIKYPVGYRVIEAKPRSETKSQWGAEILSEFELHKVTFIEIEYEMWPGQFEISVLPNEDGLGLMEWVERFMEKEEVALVEPDSDDPSIFGVGEVTIDGKPVIRLHLFNYDHTGIELFTTHNGYIYNLSFAGSNPNDPSVEEHMALYVEMIESFEFEK